MLVGGRSAERLRYLDVWWVPRYLYCWQLGMKQFPEHRFVEPRLVRGFFVAKGMKCFMRILMKVVECVVFLGQGSSSREPIV